MFRYLTMRHYILDVVITITHLQGVNHICFCLLILAICNSKSNLVQLQKRLFNSFLSPYLIISISFTSSSQTWNTSSFIPLGLRSLIRLFSEGQHKAAIQRVLSLYTPWHTERKYNWLFKRLVCLVKMLLFVQLSNNSLTNNTFIQSFREILEEVLPNF